MIKRTSRRKELEAELNHIIQQEEQDMIKTWHPIFKEKFEGKYFKYKNSYGDDNRSWPLYTKVTSVKPEHIYDTEGNGVTSTGEGFSFETDCYGKVIIDTKKSTYLQSIGDEISEKEFFEAWDEMIKSINKL